MRLKLSNDVDVNKVLPRRKKEDDSTYVAALLKVSMVIKKGLAIELLGEKMYNGLWDDSGNLYHRSFKPRDTFEAHQVSFGGLQAQKCTPSVEKLEPTEDGELRLHLAILYDLRDSKAKQVILEAYGSHLKLEIAPVQMALPFAKKDEAVN